MYRVKVSGLLMSLDVDDYHHRERLEDRTVGGDECVA